ncbi:MAG: phycobilisome protein [Alkalinema sp. RU_4_3]|nr:phycobilisome protein [Alkalinema sp. RU_4_3]
MLSQMQRLSAEAEGRYATDEELRFLAEYLSSYELRLQTYQKLQQMEAGLLQKAYEKLVAQEPGMFRSGATDLTTKWKRDTVRILRFSVTALLINDLDSHQEKMLLWFQSIARAVNVQKSCNLTYTALQEIIRPHLTEPQANLFLPILEMNRRTLANL